MRGPSAAVFSSGDQLILEKVPSRFGHVKVTLKTRWIKRGDELFVPGHIWIEIRGTGDALENVISTYANASAWALPILTLATNAAIAQPEIELGYESTLGISEREYFQSYVAPEAGIVCLGRRIDVKSVPVLMTALIQHADQERLSRAVSQYSIALSAWRLGNESLSVEHLWMAAEALTEVVVKSQMEKYGFKDKEDLAKQMRVDKDDLNSAIRKNVILKGDIDCYKKAKSASDGLEHGYLEYDIMRDKSKDVIHKLAKYIRSGIFDEIDIPTDTRSILEAAPYDAPIGNWPLVKYLRGDLLGEASSLAKKGNEYPFIRWNPQVKSGKWTDSNETSFEICDNFTPELAEGIAFRVKSVEVWKP